MSKLKELISFSSKEQQLEIINKFQHLHPVAFNIALARLGLSELDQGFIDMIAAQVYQIKEFGIKRHEYEMFDEDQSLEQFLCKGWRNEPKVITREQLLENRRDDQQRIAIYNAAKSIQERERQEKLKQFEERKQKQEAHMQEMAEKKRQKDEEKEVVIRQREQYQKQMNVYIQRDKKSQEQFLGRVQQTSEELGALLNDPLHKNANRVQEQEFMQKEQSWREKVEKMGAKITQKQSQKLYEIRERIELEQRDVMFRQEIKRMYDDDLAGLAREVHEETMKQCLDRKNRQDQERHKSVVNYIESKEKLHSEKKAEILEKRTAALTESTQKYDTRHSSITKKFQKQEERTGKILVDRWRQDIADRFTHQNKVTSQYLGRSQKLSQNLQVAQSRASERRDVITAREKYRVRLTQQKLKRDATNTYNCIKSRQGYRSQPQLVFTTSAKPLMLSPEQKIQQLSERLIQIRAVEQQQVADKIANGY